MSKSTTSMRLKQLMDERGLKQIDILKLAEPYCRKFDAKLGKSDLSQYVSGKVVPSQSKLVILGMALNVNEAWLMGYDVEMDRRKVSGDDAAEDFLLLEKYSLLSSRDKLIVMNLIDSLIEKSGE